MPNEKTQLLKTKYINTRVTQEEYQAIKEKSTNTGLSASAYLRNLGMNYPIKSVVDQRALFELVQCRADLGRLGGLFKMWLIGENGNWGDLGTRRYEDINDLVDDLIQEEEKLLRLAQRLLHVNANE